MKFLVLFSLLVNFALGREIGRFIVGGEDVDPPGKWPWQASLEVHRGGGTYSHNCGASLVSTLYLTCAAHCLTQQPLDYNIVLGAHDRNTRAIGNPTDHPVRSFIRHPDYVRDGTLGFPNDAALIRLIDPADTSSPFIGAVAMATADDESGQNPDFTQSTCYITGWGRLYGFGPLPNILQEAEVSVMEEADCIDEWGDRIQRYHICLTDVNPARQQRGACNGDSGGPLVCRNDVSEPWQLAGITSWGRAGCVTTSPSVYVRVSYFRQWFDQHMPSS